MKYLALLSLLSTKVNCNYDDEVTLLGRAKHGSPNYVNKSATIINDFKTDTIKSI